MDSVQQQAVHDLSSWFQMLWASPGAALLLLFKKSIRDGVKGFFTPKKDHGDQPITRVEFEPRMQGLHDALMAHAAQARVDNRELKAEIKADIHELKQDIKDNNRDMFAKIDNFTTLVSMRERNK